MECMSWVVKIAVSTSLTQTLPTDSLNSAMLSYLAKSDLSIEPRLGANGHTFPLFVNPSLKKKKKKRKTWKTFKVETFLHGKCCNLFLRRSLGRPLPPTH